ncbi:UPAR/Ly6 domain-containing protein crok [Anabrus simplex]|uniref:UPAR/Ly6 domain-containing protein crok n=1 Tax=Anabrus simplex TaxID=316456 RepID=UPI0035A339A5
MTSSSSYFLVGIVLFLAVAVHSGAGLRCWACTSSTSLNCRDPFNKTRIPIENCERMRSQTSMDYPACQKVVETINDGQSRIVRKCVFSRERLNGKCAEPTTLNYIKMEHCSTCEEDECNSAPGVEISPLTVAAAATLGVWVTVRSLF